MAAVYGRKEIIFSVGENKYQMNERTLEVSHPNPFASSGNLNPSCRLLLLEGTLEAVKRTGYRMCVVWGHNSATYLESDGRIAESNEPPSGGLVVNSVKVSDS